MAGNDRALLWLARARHMRAQRKTRSTTYPHIRLGNFWLTFLSKDLLCRSKKKRKKKKILTAVIEYNDLGGALVDPCLEYFRVSVFDHRTLGSSLTDTHYRVRRPYLSLMFVTKPSPFPISAVSRKHWLTFVYRKNCPCQWSGQASEPTLSSRRDWQSAFFLDIPLATIRDMMPSFSFSV